MTDPWYALSRLGFVVFCEGQTGAAKLLRKNTYLIDAMVFPNADFTYASGPPSSPDDGDMYVVQSATGDWSGHLDDIAIAYDDVWYFINSIEGLRCWDTDSDVRMIYDGSNWIEDTVQATALTDLTQSITDPPTQSEVNNIQSKVNDIISRLETSNVIAT